ncbi:DNA-directed DNA polymerase [Paenibacillus curdlanolyticus YK9]|uniref:DNA polymerase IV n=1 Tax=Paenibacillus curdlanolyticus YK9 TaxID=717606 RepID=E0I3W2_9BACL|nr:DNA polymerase IV [Paenibacillus curdlanolyticus]EFM12976.1 DNA-directed DNA polymerase [Paenibacillus curdlanolyticus YK9]
MLADCQSFYASVEKAQNPEYTGKPVVVAGDPERRSGIVLAACPLAKAKGVTTAQRLGEAIAQCPDVVIVRPRMAEYIRVSLQISDIYRSYTDLVEPYSIDEQFLDVTGTLHLHGGSPEEMAQSMQRQVLAETGIYCRIGIAENKILAKTACDNYAKKNESGLYVLHKNGLENTLWTLPIHKLFMSGNRMTHHFQSMGIETIGQLAKTPLDRLKGMMRRKFGKNSDINAELYWRIANGEDDSPVTPQTHEAPPQSIGHQMTLPRDYGSLEEIKVVLLELTELVCQRCRGKGFMGQVVAVGCQGADFDRPTGFFRQQKMMDPTNVTNQVYRAAVQLLERHWDGQPVRKVGVTLAQFQDSGQYQLAMFDDRERAMALERATDALKEKYGDSIIMRAVSVTAAGQARDRSGKIGGHYK